jgi:hypothetical protein
MAAFEYLALSENGFLFDSRTGNTFSLNRTGAFLLRKLMDGAAADDLPALLAAAFETDAENGRRDVEQFLFRLRDLKVIDAEEQEL